MNRAAGRKVTEELRRTDDVTEILPPWRGGAQSRTMALVLGVSRTENYGISVATIPLASER